MIDLECEAAVASGQRVGIDSWLSSRQGAKNRTHLRVPMPLTSKQPSEPIESP